MNMLITAILNKALDGLTLRSAATAQNIANANSDRYRPMSVSFEAALRTAAARGEGAVRALPVSMREGAIAPGSAVRMDLELETQSETAMRYGALADVLAREIQLQRTAIGGGQ